MADRMTEALVRGGLSASQKLGVRVSRAEILAEIQASYGLLDVAGRVSALLKRLAAEQGISLQGKVLDP